MAKTPAFTLKLSKHRGRYTLDTPFYHRDLATGDQIAILVGGHWVAGRVSLQKESDFQNVQDMLAPKWCFLANRDGSMCGLVSGMQVKVL